MITKAKTAKTDLACRSGRFIPNGFSFSRVKAGLERIFGLVSSTGLTGKGGKRGGSFFSIGFFSTGLIDGFLGRRNFLKRRTKKLGL